MQESDLIMSLLSAAGCLRDLHAKIAASHEIKHKADLFNAKMAFHHLYFQICAGGLHVASKSAVLVFLHCRFRL